MFAGLGCDDVEQHQKGCVRCRGIEHRHVVEPEYGHVVTVGDITFRTATYSLAGEEFIRYGLVEVGKRGELFPSCKSVAKALADEGEISDSFHRGIGYEVIRNTVGKLPMGD